MCSYIDFLTFYCLSDIMLCSEDKIKSYLEGKRNMLVVMQNMKEGKELT